jgi:hypothetical protein
MGRDAVGVAAFIATQHGIESRTSEVRHAVQLDDEHAARAIGHDLEGRIEVEDKCVDRRRVDLPVNGQDDSVIANILPDFQQRHGWAPR